MKLGPVTALEVLDSRGMPTVKVTLELGGHRGSFFVPAGASTGKAEARELRDGGARYGGKGVRKAVRRVQAVARDLRGRDFATQAAFDRVLISRRLPGNVSLGLSGAFAHAAAACRGMPLYAWFGAGRAMPRPMVNLLSGGLHGGGNMPIQDILVVPMRAPTLARAVEEVWRAYQSARRLVAERFDYLPNWVADEGGFAPRFRSVEDALGLAVDAIRGAGLVPGRDMALALDVAASHASGITIDRLEAWVRSYPIISIEDGVPEEDWARWRELTRRLGTTLQLVGDDFFATNPARLRRGIRSGCANAVLVKMNQIGTITQTLDVIRMAHEAGYRTVVSARSGETEDWTMVDLAVGASGGQIKIGSLARSERGAKYNRLLELEGELSRSRRK
jgi:enolase